MKTLDESLQTAATFSWQYLAGLFDGEGSITCPLHRKWPNLQVYIAQSGDVGYRLLTDIQEWLAQYDINAKVYKTNKMPKLGTMFPYRLIISQKVSAYRFLEYVRPFLHVKQEQVHEMLWKRELYWLAKETRRPGPIIEWPDFDYSQIERCVI